MKALRQYVVWGVDKNKPKKPFAYVNGKFEGNGWNNSEYWIAFDEAMALVEQGKAKGIGICFNGGGIYGVDLDNVFINGQLIPEAQEIVGRLDSYTELSMSGNGLHVFVYAPSVDLLDGLDKGKTEYIFPGYDPVIVIENGKEVKKRRKVEYYQSSGYIAVTGKLYAEVMTC